MHSDPLLRRGLWLEYATLAWNVVGSVIVIAAAIRAGSVTLAGFGLDLLVEIFASVVVVWQLNGVHQDRERLAMKLIGVAFLLLAAYVFAQSIWTLIAQAHPAASLTGILWLAATLAVMLGLAWGKHITGRQLNNHVLVTEARVTLIDAALAGAVLVGIGANALMGWWWSDPLAGLVIVYYGWSKAARRWRTVDSMWPAPPSQTSDRKRRGNDPAGLGDDLLSRCKRLHRSCIVDRDKDRRGLGWPDDRDVIPGTVFSRSRLVADTPIVGQTGPQQVGRDLAAEQPVLDPLTRSIAQPGAKQYGTQIANHRFRRGGIAQVAWDCTVQGRLGPIKPRYGVANRAGVARPAEPDRQSARAAGHRRCCRSTPWWRRTGHRRS